jgi:hypothetical protein
MKAIKSDQFYMSSTIPLRCTLVTNISSAKEKISAYPHIKPLHGGKFARYLIKTDNSDLFYTVELGNDVISFTTYSAISPLYSLKDSLLRLISITAILSEDYHVEANSLFPYLLTMLSKLENDRPQNPQNHNRDPQLILSRRIVYLLGENKRLVAGINLTNQNLLSIASDLILSKYYSDSSIKQICTDTGMDEHLAAKALKAIQENGNKLIYKANGNFNIVRI